MKALNFSIIKLTICFVAGILLSYFFSFNFKYALLSLIGALLVFIIAFIVARRQWLQSVFFGVATYLLFVVIGIIVWQIQLPENNTRHYTNHIGLPSQVQLKGTVREVLKPYTNYENYVIDVLEVNNQSVEGKLLLKVRTDSITSSLNVDNVVVFANILEEIPKPLNPHQFDYSNYMKHQKVLMQSQVAASEIFVTNSNLTTYRGYAYRTREHIVEALKENGFKNDELGIIKALLLGQKDDISRETYNNYAAAGVIHILAVSGLHVGIILAILQFILSPLFRFKYGNIAQAVLIVILLWGFAILAGLSPSVTRAVTMFSFYAIALNLKKRTNTINTLFLSALVLLLLNPEFLFTVGFQLSYLAVFSIVLLQPVLYDLVPRPKYYIPRIFWSVFTVTLAAQVGVLPLSLFYFHQFPGLFFLTNVVVIPFLTLILGYGILCIILSILNILPAIVADGFQYIISTMNTFIAWVGQQESFLFKDIHFSEIQTIVSYALIGIVLLSLRNFKPRRFIYIAIGIIIFQLGFMYDDYMKKNTKEFVVFHQTAETVLGYQLGDSLFLNTSDVKKENQYLQRNLNNYRVGKGFNFTKIDSVGNVISVFNKTIFIIDSLGVYDDTFSNEIILLRNSPKVNLSRLIDSLHPIQIIADGSNYKSYVKRWKETARIKKLPFHHTGEKGAFLIQD